METDILKTDDQMETEIVRSLTAVGKHFGISQPAISKWKKLGMPIEEDGSYNLKRITAWRALRVAQEADSLLPAKAEGEDAEVLAEVKKELGRFRGLIDTYKMDRGDVFAGTGAKLLEVAERILSTIKDRQLEKMPIKDRLKSLKDIVSSVTGLYVQERLENDQSTSNVAIIVASIRDLKRRMAESERS